MNLIFSKRTLVLFPAIILICAISFYSCQKELTGGTDAFVPVLPDLISTVNSSVSGFVTDENDKAVSGADVRAGNSFTLTDKYGFFEIINAPVVKDAAVVTITRPGYFKGIKTYLATGGKAAFFRIKLIPKINAGNIDAATGGNVTLSNGLVISLPANIVVNAATNSAYIGQVNVSAKWIDPTGNDLNLTMPGDLRGLDSIGSIKLLTTFGMAAVELTGTAGELLQIATGKKATVTIPLPATLSATAPSTISLWYFDETTGLWKEQGFAVKTGTGYICDVSHFSFWNCDVPCNYVRFNCTITDAKGIPVQNALVKISVVGNPQSAGYGYTDSSGFTGGAVPNNAQLLLQVFSENNCITALYAQNFITGNTNITLGQIKVAAAGTATITGNVINCTGAAVQNGYLIMEKGGVGYHYRIDSTGAFNFSTMLCPGNDPVSFVAEDINALQVGQAASVVLLTGTNAIGTLAACGITIQQFINYTINGTNYSLIYLPDSISQSITPFAPPAIYVKGYAGNNGAGNSAFITFTQPGITVNSNQDLLSFYSGQINDSTLISTPISVKITEYGAIGQFMAGNFTGTFTGSSPANTIYNVTCSFRVRRNQ